MSQTRKRKPKLERIEPVTDEEARRHARKVGAATDMSFLVGGRSVAELSGTPILAVVHVMVSP